MSDRFATWFANGFFIAHIVLAAALLLGLGIYYLVGIIWGINLFF